MKTSHFYQVTSNCSKQQQQAINEMPTAESQVNYEDFLVAENETEVQENQVQDVEDEDIGSDTDDESRFDAAGCVSLIYKVEMEDKKGTDLPIKLTSPKLTDETSIRL